MAKEIRKLLLAAVALLAVSTVANATPDVANATLPDTMLGNWCYDYILQAYVRAIPGCGDDTAIQVRKDGFVTIDIRCKFDKIEQTGKITYMVHSICTPGEDEGYDDGE